MITKKVSKKAAVITALAVLSSFGFNALATAVNEQGANRSVQRQAQQQKALDAAVAAGETKIDNRLRRLETLLDRINSTDKLSNASKAYLTSEVSSTSTDLQDLKSELLAAESAKQARETTKSVVQDTRVYLLVVKKVHLTKLSDHMLTKQAALLSFAELAKARAEATANSEAAVAKLDTAIANTTSTMTATTTTQQMIFSVTTEQFNQDKKVLKEHFAKLKELRRQNIADYRTIVEVVNQLR